MCPGSTANTPPPPPPPPPRLFLLPSPSPRFLFPLNVNRLRQCGSICSSLTGAVAICHAYCISFHSASTGLFQKRTHLLKSPHSIHSQPTLHCINLFTISSGGTYSPYHPFPTFNCIASLFFSLPVAHHTPHVTFPTNSALHPPCFLSPSGTSIARFPSDGRLLRVRLTDQVSELVYGIPREVEVC